MTKTHLGALAHDLILLEAIGVTDSRSSVDSLAFFRIKYENGDMDPTGGTFGYTAPKGKAIIITEVDWQYESGRSYGNVTLRIFLSWPGSIEMPGRRVLESTILLGRNGGGGTSTSETTGIVVPYGVKIAVDAAGSGASGKIQHVLMRGYLCAFK